MLKGVGYKNERVLSLSIDLLIISGILAITFLLFGFPNFFPYYEELEQALTIINPKEYMEVTGVIHSKFEKTILEVFIIYVVYETILLVFFGQTVGRKLFHKKVVLDFECKYPLLTKILIFPMRTIFKAWCFYWMFPVLVIGTVFFFTKKEKTLIDMIFMTKTVLIEH